ncbi:MAG: alanyl-tRNA editing protein [Halobacteriaceae archaeon]
MTDQRYLEDTYATEIETEIGRVVDDRIVLEETIFYPEGGGQPADHGVVFADGQKWTVVDVQKKDTIYHHLDGEPPAAGTEIRGELDWERRYGHMRHHTAQHLVSAILLDEFDAETTGNQVYADRARIDCSFDRFSDDDLSRIEGLVNGYIADERDVAWYMLDRETAEEELDPERTRLHLLPDSIREVRIVEIDGVDKTACAGTHVRNTQEINEFRVTGRETKGSDEERIHFALE